MTRVIFVVFTMMTGGAAYATYTGVGAESTDVSRSIRSGSGGNLGYVGGVK